MKVKTLRLKADMPIDIPQERLDAIVCRIMSHSPYGRCSGNLRFEKSGPTSHDPQKALYANWWHYKLIVDLDGPKPMDYGIIDMAEFHLRESTGMYLQAHSVTPADLTHFCEPWAFNVLPLGGKQKEGFPQEGTVACPVADDAPKEEEVAKECVGIYIRWIGWLNDECKEELRQIGFEVRGGDSQLDFTSEEYRDRLGEIDTFQLSGKVDGVMGPELEGHVMEPYKQVRGVLLKYQAVEGYKNNGNGVTLGDFLAEQGVDLHKEIERSTAAKHGFCAPTTTLTVSDRFQSMNGATSVAYFLIYHSRLAEKMEKTTD